MKTQARNKNVMYVIEEKKYRNIKRDIHRERRNVNSGNVIIKMTQHMHSCVHREYQFRLVIVVGLVFHMVFV